MVALRVVSRNPTILIHVEGLDIFEGNLETLFKTEWLQYSNQPCQPYELWLASGTYPGGFHLLGGPAQTDY